MKKYIKLSVLVVFLLISDFTHSTSVHPEYTLTIANNRYIIDFTMPAYQVSYDFDDEEEETNMGINWREMDNDVCPPFCYINVDGDCDYTDEITYPELPFFSIPLLLPDDATNVQVSFTPMVIQEVYFNEYVQPAIAGDIIDPYTGSTLPDTTCFNTFYYTNGYDSNYPHGFYRNFYDTSGIYSLLNTKGYTLSIHPFEYYPQYGYAKVLMAGQFIIDFNGDDVNGKMVEVQQGTKPSDMVTQLYYVTFDDCAISRTEQNPKYLIIAAHSNMDESLRPFVRYKQNQGYNVEVAYLDRDNMLRVGGHEMADYIEMKAPDYVLLVGNKYDIPAYSGNLSMSNPYTDDPYHPFLGRWMINYNDASYPELDTIITKTIQAESDFQYTHTSAILYSGIDNKRSRSRYFYKDVRYLSKKIFDRMGFYNELRDGRDNGVGFYTMQNDIQQHPHFFIYRGHGYGSTDGYVNDEISGIARPYNVVPTNYRHYYNSIHRINLLNNSSSLPMGYGFSCLLNTYETNNNFGARWVAESCGGVTFYGSTTSSWSATNRYLSRQIFQIYKNCRYQNFPISWLNYIGESMYFYGRISVSRKHQIQKYNLMGDPTFYVYGRDEWGNIAPSHSPERTFIDEKNINNDFVLYDMLGRKIGVFNNALDIPSGMFFVEQQSSEGVKYIKILK